MSMLSDQRDKLRKMASELREHGTFAGYGGTVNRNPLMHDAAAQMELAADAIWHLRNVGAENAELRELARDMYEELRGEHRRVAEGEFAPRMAALGIEVEP